MSSAYPNHTVPHHPLSRLDNILSSLQTFRQTQEAKIMNESVISSNDSNYFSDGKPKTTQKLIIANKSNNNKDGTDFMKLFDVNVLLISSGVFSTSVWPLALACNFNELFVDLSFMESHGSLWRILKRPDSFPGTRIILQSSEIGERTLYLTSELTLVNHIDAAAVWNVYISKSSQSNSSYSSLMSLDRKNNNDSTNNTFISSTVKLELFDGLPASAIVEESRYLASVLSKSGQRGIALISESEIKEEDKDDELSFGFLWEIILESADVIGPDFYNDIVES